MDRKILRKRKLSQHFLNYNQNATIKITGNKGQIEEITQEIENDPDETENHNEKKVWMTYDPTRDDMSEIVLVRGTDETYESPETFEKAWNHENNYLRSKWREAIKKELENMEINHDKRPSSSR